MNITMRSPVVVDDEVVAAIAELTQQATSLLPQVDDLARRYYEVERTAEAAIGRRADREDEIDGELGIVERATGLSVLRPLMEDMGRALDASLGGSPGGHPSWYEPRLATRLAETEEA